MSADLRDIIVPNSVIRGPFGPAKWAMTLPTAQVVDMYRRKCNVDVSPDLPVSNIHLYECQLTGMRFWMPNGIDGNESFYARLSAAWPTYYKPWRWEYDLASKYVLPKSRVLEIGCGRGYFLRHVESRSGSQASLGLELNNEAIANKVTSLAVWPITIQELSCEDDRKFDLVCAFQVLEHIVDVESFIRSSIKCLSPGGLLLFSTPNPDFVRFANREDAFDLPPHHVNQFTESAYSKIGDYYGLKIHKFHRESRSPTFEAITASTRQSGIFRVARKLSYSLMSAGYAFAKEPGATNLVVYRKLTQ